MNLNLFDMTAIRNWAQRLIDHRIKEMLSEDTETMDIEEDRAMVHAAIHEEYAIL